MNKSKQNSQKKPSRKNSNESDKIDKDLKELIDESEFLKKGISKLFIEIEKNKTN